MADPFREQRLSAGEVRRVLQRAAELADGDPETAATEKSMTRSELEQAAADLGLPASAIERALSGQESRSSASTYSSFIGAPTRIVFEQEVAGEPTDSDREDLLEEIREFVGETGSFETVGKTLVWKLAPMQGRARELTVRLRAREGRTRIVVEERLVRQATGLFVGLGVGGGVGPLGGYIAAVATLGVVGLLLPLVWIPLMLLLARTIFTGLARRREEALRELFTRLTKCAAGWSATAKPRRIRVPESREDSNSEAEAEAEEAGAGARARSSPA